MQNSENSCNNKSNLKEIENSLAKKPWKTPALITIEIQETAGATGSDGDFSGKQS